MTSRPIRRGVSRAIVGSPHPDPSASEESLDVLARGNRVTLDDLHDARRFTAKIRQLQPELLRRSDRVS